MLDRQAFVQSGPTERFSHERLQNPVPPDQSTAVVWPYLRSLAALTLVCFGVSYIVFMRQEIRSV